MGSGVELNLNFLKKIFRFFLLTSLLAVTIYCQRAPDEKTSVAIQIPSAQQLGMQSINSQSVVDLSLLCFVVDIQGGNNITRPAQTCQPQKGELIGSVPAGSTLNASVIAGTYNFKIYAVKRTSSTETCPVVNLDNWGVPLSRVYYLGEVLNKKIEGEKASVTIPVTLPDESHHLISSLSLPASCNTNTIIGNTLAAKQGRVLMGGKFINSANYKMYGKVGFIPVNKTLTSSSGLKIKNWEAGPL